MYTGTRPGVSPAIRAGKGWRGRRELAPRCSATQLSACLCVHIDRDMIVIPSSEPPPPLLPEVAGPQGRPVAPLSPGAGVPSLASPALAGAAGEVVDSSALAFLAARAVQVREEEEAEELRQLDEVLATAEDRLVEAFDPLRHDESRPRWSSLSPVEQAACHWYAAWLRREKRKRRKKRRKKRRRTRTTRRTRFSTATVLLRPFVLFWLRFPGKHSGRARFVQSLFVLLENVRLYVNACYAVSSDTAALVVVTAVACLLLVCW